MVECRRYRYGKRLLDICCVCVFSLGFPSHPGGGPSGLASSLNLVPPCDPWLNVADAVLHFRGDCTKHVLT